MPWLLVLFVIALMMTGPAAAQTPPRGLGGFAPDQRTGQRRQLPATLREISGLAVTADGRVLGHDDELATVYELDPRWGTVVKAFHLGSTPVRGDFEGIALAGEQLYLVTSDGTIYESVEGRDGEHVRYRAHRTRLGRQCEIEGLAFEPAGRVLLLPCKRVRVDAWQDSVVIFRWSLDRRQMAEPSRIALPKSRVLAGMGGDRFRPSAIEVHPETGTYFVLSARDPAVIEITPSGDLLDVRELRDAGHPQAEGIAFTGDLVLVIADEGDHRGTLTLYRGSQRPRDTGAKHGPGRGEARGEPGGQASRARWPPVA
jgi:uncharacterized protein YjiK